MVWVWIFSGTAKASNVTLFPFSHQFQLKPDKFDMHNRDSRLTLSVTQDSTVSIHLKDAVPDQLRQFLDLVNGVKAYGASFQGKNLGNLFVLHKHQYLNVAKCNLGKVKVKTMPVNGHLLSWSRVDL